MQHRRKHLKLYYEDTTTGLDFWCKAFDLALEAWQIAFHSMSEILRNSSDLAYENMSLELYSSTIFKELHLFIFFKTDRITEREIFLK